VSPAAPAGARGTAATAALDCVRFVTTAPPRAGYSPDGRPAKADGRRGRARRMVDRIEIDEWTVLHRHDPVAFDARRQALLALELARADATAAATARAALRRLESRLAGAGDAERVQASMIWMAASLKLLGSRLERMADAIGRPQHPAD